MTIMNLTKFTPYPGSPVYRELYGTSIRDDHWEKMNGQNFVWAPDGISVQALDRHYQDVINWFYTQKRVRRICEPSFDRVGFSEIDVAPCTARLIRF